LSWDQPDPALKHRTRFFIELAKDHGPRLAALVYLVAVHTEGRRRKGIRGRKNAWHQTAAWYGKQIGVSSRQISRLLAQAGNLGLLDYQRTGRGLLVWVVGKRPCSWLDQHRRGNYVVGYYDISLAKGLGIRAACILDLLDHPMERNNADAFEQLYRAANHLGLNADRLSALVRKGGYPDPVNEEQSERQREYRQLTYKEVSRLMPWISEREADYELRRLHRLGLIKRRALDLRAASVEEARWIYYSEKCLQKSPGSARP
jgi:hypothetical protein